MAALEELVQEFRKEAGLVGIAGEEAVNTYVQTALRDHK
jgi:hypothetical protein